MRGRPVKTIIRERIATILGQVGSSYGYEIFKTYRKIFGKVSLRNLYYNLKKGLKTGEFIIVEDLDYETPSTKLKKIPKIIDEIIKKVKHAKLDRVHFNNFGDFSLGFEIVYYVNVPDYAKYMDIQQEINFKIKERFEKEKIEMAYPTQKLYLSNE